MKAADLRRSILQMAVQGKLVPQDFHDESATELLARIKVEKARLIKEGKIKKDKPLLPIAEDEIPHDLPDGWIWCRAGDICTYIQRGKSPVYSDIEQIPVVSQKCVQWSGIDMTKAKFICPISFGKYDQMRMLKTGDLLWNSTGSGTLGRIMNYDESVNHYEHAVADSHVTVLRPYKNHTLSQYLFNWFSGPIVQGEIEQKATGSTKQIELATATIRSYIVPLPPLKEQQRIVDKVDELMAMCDELEAAEKELDNLEKHFVEYLPKSILQIAVQGKLVPQELHDEPASELLVRIKAEKTKLIKEGKLKKEDPLPPIMEDEVPFDLPDGWIWCKLRCITSKVHYGYTASAQDKGSAKLLRITDIQNNRVNWDAVPFCSIEAEKILGYELNQGDILIARTGGTIGKTYLVNNVTEKAVFASYLIRIIPLPDIYCVEYLKFFLESPLYWEQLRDKTMGTGQPNVNGQSLSNLILPLPPFAEQQRIVAKVDELMALCDELKSAQNMVVPFTAGSTVIPFPSIAEEDPLLMVAQGAPAQEQSIELRQAINDLFGDGDDE